MPTIVDLTLPIESHFRWPTERKLRGDFDRGDSFQITYLGLVVHGFTHVDSPRHIVPDGDTTSDLSLDRLVGEAAVVDLADIAPESAISADLVADRGEHIRPGDIVLLKTCWDRRQSHHDEAFWTTAPYLTREACEWLLRREIKALGVDFPQDYPIRQLLAGHTAPMSEFVSHDVLLRRGVVLIEYLCNLGALESPRTTVIALPMKVPEADGAPARVIALEPD